MMRGSSGSRAPMMLLPWALALALRLASGATLERRGYATLLSSRRADPHPFRCSMPLAKCGPFGSGCSKDADCYSYHCYKGKCGYARQCSSNGELCRAFSAHTCCSGKCKQVTMVDDCHRLLKGSGSPAMNHGVNLNRQCQNLGVCEPFDDMPKAPILSVPWAVPATDLAVKYNQRSTLTFKEGSIVRADLFIAKKAGQTYNNIPADSMKPGAIRDAGVIMFTDDSKVHPEFGEVVTEYVPVGDTGVTHTLTYCVAPILRNGVGGGYFAVCKGGCGKPPKNPAPSTGSPLDTPPWFKFECGDALDASVKSGLVLGLETEKFAQAQQKIETKHGFKFHDKTKGITTQLPMYVRMLKDYVGEYKAATSRTTAAMPDQYTYVTPSTVSQCVAPVMDGTGKQVEAEFWAVGYDCCDSKGGFHCGAVDKKGSRSAEVVSDPSGSFRQTVTMAELRYNLKAPAVPMYLDWKEGILVPTPTKVD